MPDAWISTRHLEGSSPNRAWRTVHWTRGSRTARDCCSGEMGIRTEGKEGRRGAGRKLGKMKGGKMMGRKEGNEERRKGRRGAGRKLCYKSNRVRTTDAFWQSASVLVSELS